MKTEHQRRVEEFMWLAGQEVPDRPTMPSEEVRLLRARLILEEALETITLGLGFRVRAKGDPDCLLDLLRRDLVAFDSRPSIVPPDLEQIADGCADISVVTIGTLSACGIADGPILREVDAANLRKFGPGSRRREDGKWLKPPDWEPPKIRERLEEQGDD